MIRANLLPRPNETFAAFGWHVDRDYLRQSAAGLALVVLVAAIGCGIERARIDRAQTELDAERAALAEREPEREFAKGLALDVARYQEFARETALFRRSGADAAYGVARIGNAVPDDVWLDALDRDTAGYALTGEALTVAAVGATILHLGATVSGTHVELVSLDARTSDRPGIRFDAHFGTSAPSPMP